MGELRVLIDIFSRETLTSTIELDLLDKLDLLSSGSKDFIDKITGADIRVESISTV